MELHVHVDTDFNILLCNVFLTLLVNLTLRLPSIYISVVIFTRTTVPSGGRSSPSFLMQHEGDVHAQLLFAARHSVVRNRGVDLIFGKSSNDYI